MITTTSVPCPSCGAAANTPCHTRMGRMVQNPHAPRVDAANAARQAAQAAADATPAATPIIVLKGRSIANRIRAASDAASRDYTWHQPIFDQMAAKAEQLVRDMERNPATGNILIRRLERLAAAKDALLAG